MTEFKPAVIAMALLACAMTASQTYGRELSPDQAQELREALMYSQRAPRMGYARSEKAARCMVSRIGATFGHAEYAWALKFYRGELNQAEIDRDPYNVMDFLFDTAASCKRVSGDSRPHRIRFTVASRADRKIVVAAKGRAFVNEVGAFPTRLLTARVNIGSEENPIGAMAVVQKAECSNHACTVYLLQQGVKKWTSIASVETWGAPYLVEQDKSPMRDLIYFDHTTNDCLACSSPTPFRLTWSAARSRYVKGETIPHDEAKKFKADTLE